MPPQDEKPTHRSIQDIIPPARSKPIRPQMTPPHVPPPPTPPQPLDMRPNRPRGMAGMAFVVAGVLIVLGVVLGVITTFFHRAYVTVTPNRYSAEIQSTFSSSPEDALLPYNKVTADDTASKSVPATGSKHVENHASGTITVYNSFSTKSERLITNTRFATKDGLIYKVHTPIVIPGYTTKAGVKVPGSVEVVVYADEAGDKYNATGSVDFTIPGLKGSQQFDLMFAKSKTSIAGGFVGEQAVVDPAVRAEAVESLKADLERSLRDKILATKPTGSLIFGDTVAITYAEGTDTVDGSNANVTVSGSASAPAFPESSFASALASTGGVAVETALMVENPNDLSVHLNTPDALGSGTPLSVTVSGSAKLISVIDMAQLAKDLAGKSKDSVQTILPAYPGISDIVVKVYPFWRSHVPVNTKDISIELAGGLDQTH